MTSPEQTAANRRNAQRSTGPRTPAGKAITRLNAVTHGGLSTLPVIPGVETADAWENHRIATLASLEPRGHLETILAERVALLLWRLGRMTRCEREMIAVGLERVEEELTEARRLRVGRGEGPDHPRDLRAALARARERLRLLQRVRELEDDAPLAGADAEAILCAVADQTENVDLDDFALPTLVPDEIAWGEYGGWTVGGVRRGIAAMAAEDEIDAALLLGQAVAAAQQEVHKLEPETKRVAAELDRMRRERLLPGAATLEMLTRYEAHLSRQLGQALHELQRLQATRAGAPVPPPLALDVTVSGAA